MTPLRFLELLFVDALVDMIVGYTKLESHKGRADINFEITKEKFAFSQACYCLVGAISLQNIK